MVYRFSVILFLLVLAFEPLPSQGFSDGPPSSPPPPPSSHNSASDPQGLPDESSTTVTSHPFFRSRPCHYSTVGFPLRDGPDPRDDIMQLCRDVFEHPACRRFPSPVNPGYSMLQWASSCGAELWGGADKENKLTSGPDPHFFGRSRVQLELTKKIVREDEAMFFGEARAMREEVPPEDEKIYRDEEGVQINMGLQMEFQCPAYQRCGKELQVPSMEEQEQGKTLVVPAQVAAFAHEVVVYDSLEEYDAMNERKEEGSIRLASQSFTNMRHFLKKEDKDQELDKPFCALMTGHVLEAEEKINEYSGEVYYWALVETAMGIQLDVVIHPKLLDHQNPPRVGSIVEGAFFLSTHFFPDRKY